MTPHAPAPLVISLGEPSGIGPEIIAKAWGALRLSGPAFFVVGDADALGAALQPPAPIERLASPGAAPGVFARALPVLDHPLSRPARAGRPSPEAARCVVDWIETSVQLVLLREARALVTAPIAKAPLYAAGFTFPGHTEFLGALAPPRDPQARGPVMMLTAQDLRVALVTIHEPLSRAPGLLSVEAIANAGRVVCNALATDFGLSHPRLAVAGLNPHAGESGALGREEIDIIAPAIAALAAEGRNVSGPYPADSLFHAEARRRFDAVLCMYHDQALIPVKMLDFWGGVNVTLGLPIIRTSPDHGVGFDIAGQGVARPDSLIAAIRLADCLAQGRATT